MEKHQNPVIFSTKNTEKMQKNGFIVAWRWPYCRFRSCCYHHRIIFAITTRRLSNKHKNPWRAFMFSRVFLCLFVSGDCRDRDGAKRNWGDLLVCYAKRFRSLISKNQGFREFSREPFYVFYDIEIVISGAKTVPSGIKIDIKGLA
jgi:hypothetical protein